MARKGRSKGKPENLDDEGGPIEYKLVSGQVVNVYPISPRLVQVLEERYVVPEPPVMEIPTIDGDAERMPNPDDEDYKAELADIQREHAAALLRLVALRGLKDIEVSPDDEWIEELKWVEPSWEVPEDPRDLKVDYLEYWLIPSRLDWEAIKYLTIARSALSKEDVERTLQTFRTALQGDASKAIGDSLAAHLLPLRVRDKPGGPVVGDDAG